MALTRLSKDNELVALRTSGIPFLRVIRPLLFMGLVISLLSFFTNEIVVPRANHISENIIREIFLKQPTPAIQEQIFFHGNHNRYFYIQKVHTQEPVLEGVMIYELTDSKFPRIITAENATYSKQTWTLHHGNIHNLDNNGMLTYAATFESLGVTVAEDPIYFTDQKTTQEMSSGELQGLIHTQKNAGASVERLLTDFYLKFSIPLTCFIFALIGIPLSIPAPRTGRAWGVVVTIGIIFTFYVVASILRSLGYGGKLMPLVAASVGHVAFGAIGMYLIYRADQKC